MNPVFLAIAFNLAIPSLLLLPTKPIPPQIEKCGGEHMIRLSGGGAVHDAWSCKNSSACYGDGNKK